MAKIEVPIRDKKLLTIEEASAILGTSISTVRKVMNKARW